MSYINIMIHCVWSTKYREPQLLTPSIRRELFFHIYEQAHLHGIYIDTIGGWTDHVHCLISLKPTQKLCEVIQQIKGESAHWFNAQGKGRLVWQKCYFAISVSDNRVNIVRNYIRKQESHHARQAFQAEIMDFLKKISVFRDKTSYPGD